MQWKSELRFRYATKLFLSHILAVVLVSGSVGTFFYVRAMDNLMRSLQSRLQNSAALLSQTLDARDLESIRSAEDLQAENYLAALEKVRRVRRTNPDIAFMYVMRRAEDGTVQFVVDSDETDAQAPPGKIYEDVVPEMLEGFHGPVVDKALYKDEWGVFLSGYAPVRNGQGRYLVGIDMRADEVRNNLRELRLTGLASLFASILLALVFALTLSRGLGRRIGVLARHCRDLAMGRRDVRIEARTFDEFDDLAEAFNTMSAALGGTRAELERAIAELKASQHGLEDRVAERTRQLQETVEKMDVLRGLLPICSACKKIRDDQGYWKQVEQFVGEHTGARFSHGICPDCQARLYGDIAGDHPAGDSPRA
jgi:HAMP domain-containing protein